MPTHPALPHAVALPLFPPSTAYPHKRQTRLLPLVKLGGNIVLILLVLAALMAVLVDVVNQFVHSSRTSKVADVMTALGLYIAVVVTAAFLTLIRLWQNIQSMTLCTHNLIENEYDRVCVISETSKPRGRTFAGWGEPGTPFDGVHFRSTILGTISTLRAALLPSFPPLATTTSARSSPLSPLAPLLSLDPSPIPTALLPLAKLYEQKLVQAKYGRDAPAAKDWDAVVKAVAVFVGVLQGKEARGGDLGAGG
ncbi:hypothetical protein JCM6882_003616 [Rhodosporidiobolus microsporus]